MLLYWFFLSHQIGNRRVGLPYYLVSVDFLEQQDFKMFRQF